MAINDEDHDFIIGLKASNETYQQQLVDKYSGYLLSFALKKGLIREDAIEVINDVFYKAIININNFDLNRDCKFKTWLTQIAKNSIIDKFRKTKQSSFEEAFQPLDEKSDQINDEACQRSDCSKSNGENLSTALLLEALDDLNETDKTLVLERSYNTPFKDIAISIGKTENATKVAYGRAIEKLKRTYIAKLDSKDETTRSALKAYLS